MKVYIITLFFCCVLHCNCSDQSTLEMVHIILRHGDRTPDLDLVFPGNVADNADYYPIAHGGLTMNGKKTIYRVGKALRKRYDQFLGDTYCDDLVYGLASGYERTRETFQLCMASLFPAKGEYVIEEGMSWQPVDFEYVDMNNDTVFAVHRKCPQLIERPIDVAKASEEELKVLEILNQYSGWNVKDYGQLYFIQNTLQTQEENGVDLPEWVRDIWPEPLFNMTWTVWDAIIENKTLLSLPTGKIWKIIVDDTLAKMSGNLVNRKLNFFTAHDLNIGCLLGLLGAYKHEMIPYGSYILIEIHKVGSEYGVKVFYENHTKATPITIKLPNCDTLCPLEKFFNLTHIDIWKEFCAL